MLIEKTGLYDRGKELNWKYLKDMQFLTAMGTPGGGRNEIDPRFASLFNVFNITFPKDESLDRIFSNILLGHVSIFSREVQVAADLLTKMTLQLYSDVVQKLPPTPSKFHYVFNVRDISRVYEGLSISTPEHFTTVQHFVRLWRNECLRVFHDRLVSQADKDYLQKALNYLVT